MGLLVASRGRIHEWQQRKEPVHETTRIKRLAGFMKEIEKLGNNGGIHEQSKQDPKENGCPDYQEN